MTNDTPPAGRPGQWPGAAPRPGERPAYGRPPGAAGAPDPGRRTPGARDAARPLSGARGGPGAPAHDSRPSTASRPLPGGTSQPRLDDASPPLPVDPPASASSPSSASSDPSSPGAAPRPPAPPSGVDLARAALRAAKEQARERGALVQQKKQARRGGLRSGARADGRDPVPLASAIRRLITDQAWETPAAVGGVMGRWPQIVGDDLAHHCVPLSYDDDPEERVLTVQCDSTAWATQVRLLAPQLLARLNQDLGQGTVKRIKVQGPHAPVRRFGPLRAPGSRGPGDTYG